MLAVSSVVYRTTNRLCENLQCHLKSNAKTRLHCGYHVRFRNGHTAPKSGPWNVLFFGTDDFAVESLRSLHSKYRAKILHRLEVVTVNRKPENSVTKYARQNDIITHDWPLQFQINDFHLGAVVSFGHLIPSDVINAFPLGMINVHASLLPKWRGAAPIVHSIMNGDQQTGITIMKIMPKKFDIGEILAQREIGIGPHETMPELRSKLAKLGAELLVKTIEDLPQILSSAKSQSESNVTYAPKIKPGISLVKWNEMSAKKIYDLQRALFGLYPITTKFQSSAIKLLNIAQLEELPKFNDTSDEPPGMVMFDKSNNILVVKCAEDSWISVKNVLMPGRSPMNARDFSNGFLAGKKRTKAYFE